MTDVVIEQEALLDPTWVAVYDANEEDYLFQYAPDGTENRYGDIDRERLKEFHVIDRKSNRTLFAVALEPGQRLIFRKRISMSGIVGEKMWEILLVGWQQTINGKNVQSLNWIFPDGSIIQTGKFQEAHPIFYSVELLDFEKNS